MPCLLFTRTWDILQKTEWLNEHYDSKYFPASCIPFRKFQVRRNAKILDLSENVIFCKSSVFWRRKVWCFSFSTCLCRKTALCIQFLVFPCWSFANSQCVVICINDCYHNKCHLLFTCIRWKFVALSFSVYLYWICKDPLTKLCASIKATYGSASSSLTCMSQAELFLPSDFTVFTIIGIIVSSYCFVLVAVIFN